MLRIDDTDAAAERRRSAGADSARLPVAGPRLGRRAGGRRAVRAVLSVAAAGQVSGGGRASCWRAGAAYRDYATTEELQAEREAAQEAGRPFLYSRRWMAETRRRCRDASRPKGGRASCG